VLRLDHDAPTWPDRDRFILSKGHGGLALYAVLRRAGLLEDRVYRSYLQEDAMIGGEPCTRDCPWVESSTGSLGHGLPVGVGMAIALQRDHSPAKVYVLLGDGECEEGTVWEAAMSAAAFGTDNLTAILDCNEIQKMGFVKDTIGNPAWIERWQSFGWTVEEVDGHDVRALTQTLSKDNQTGKPRLVIAHTVKGKGVSIMENNPNWHFKLPNRKELKVFKTELEIPDSELE